MVEPRGVEPLSEDQTSKVSPSAVYVLTFPPSDSHRQDSDFSSFINPAARKALDSWFPAFSTPLTCAAGGSGATIAD